MHCSRETNDEGFDGWVHAFEFWPSSAEPAGRPDMADIWKEDRFRMYLPKGDQVTPQIEAAVATFRRDLWRADTPVDNTEAWTRRWF